MAQRKYYLEEGWADNVQQFIGTGSGDLVEPIPTNMGNGIPQYFWTNADALVVTFHVNHDIKVGSSMYPHVHWAPALNMAAGETVTWRLTFDSAIGHHQGGVIGTTATTVDLTYVADGTELAGEHLITEVGDADAFLAPEVDSIIIMKVQYLDGTYTGDAWGFMADLHYQIDGNSTKNKTPDFYI